MPRLAFRALVALGVLTAAAVLDLSPRAAAGYVSVGAPSASVALRADSQSPHSPDPSPIAHRFTLPFGLPIVVPQQSGGMSTTGTSTAGADGPASGVVTPSEIPDDGIARYFRSPEAVLDLARFIDSILDPPRGF